MILLSVREHSERGLVVRGLTAEHGVQAGLTRVSDRARREIQPGNRAQAQWSARLAEQLGFLSLEVTQVTAAPILDDPLALLGLQSLTALAALTLPEREPCPSLYAGASLVLDHLSQPDIWPWLLVRWEVELLTQLGYGLEIDRCALTGKPHGLNDVLAYVSPKTGRAVTLSAGAPWADKLLPLPGFLLGQTPQQPQEVLDGLHLTGHFLSARACAALDRPLPTARESLAQRLAIHLGLDRPTTEPDPEPEPPEPEPTDPA